MWKHVGIPLVLTGMHVVLQAIEKLKEWAIEIAGKDDKYDPFPSTSFPLHKAL